MGHCLSTAYSDNVNNLHSLETGNLKDVGSVFLKLQLGAARKCSINHHTV